MIEIIKNFKMEESSKASKYRDALENMQSGDAFLVEETERQHVQQAAYRYGFKISTRKQPDGSIAVIRL